MDKLFMVKAKCGHVGRNKYIIKQIPIIAQSKKEAAKIARNTPRVKHDLKDAVLDVLEVDLKEFNILKSKYNIDKYFKCKSIQEQRATCNNLYNQVLYDTNIELTKNRVERIAFLFKKRKVDKWIRNS